jgi:hypothetical protein
MTTETQERPVEGMENIFAPIAAMVAPDSVRIAKRANSFLRMVESMSVETEDDYKCAHAELTGIKDAWKAMEADRTGFTGPLNAILDKINARFQPHLKTLKAAETIIKNKMLGYTAAQEKIAADARRAAEEAAAAERRRLEDEARAIAARAEAERQALVRAEAERAAAAAAEQKRLADEAAAAAAAGNAAAAAAAEAAAKAASEKAAAEAQEAQRVRDAAAHAAALEVAAVQSVAAVVVAAPTVAAPLKVSGLSTSKTMDYEVENMAKVIVDIAMRLDTQPELANLLIVDGVKMRAYVKALGANTKIDGVRVFEKKSLRAA